jgi:hypothetical protein
MERDGRAVATHIERVEAHKLHSDEIAQFAIDLWPPARFRDFQRQNAVKPARYQRRMVSGWTTRRIEQACPELGQPHHQRPVTDARPKTWRRTPQGDAELMTKKQVLDFKPAPRLEEVDGEHGERMQEREHRSRSCDDSTQRCDSHTG